MNKLIRLSIIVALLPTMAFALNNGNTIIEPVLDDPPVPIPVVPGDIIEIAFSYEIVHQSFQFQCPWEITLEGTTYYSGKPWLGPSPDPIVTRVPETGTLPITIPDLAPGDYAIVISTWDGLEPSWKSSEVPIQVISPVIEVGIDIKPGSMPNTINLGSNGVIPVAILSYDDPETTEIIEFDATTINPDTVELEGAGVAVRGKGNKYLAHEEDVNGDGLLDLVCQVETENLDQNLQSGWAILSIHETVDPESPVIYEGMDEIIIVPPE